MKDLMKKFTKKQKIMSVVILVLLIVGSIGGTVIYQTMNKGQAMATLDMATLYQDEVVEMQDIIVGISETGTASLVYEQIELDSGYEVTEIYAVAGVYVNEGDILATINLEQSDVNNEEEEDELYDAQLSLEQLEVETASKKVEAQNTYNKAIATGENAELVYNTTIAEIDSGLISIESEMAEWSAKITDATNQLTNGLTDDGGVATATSELEVIQASVDAKTAEIEAATDETIKATLTAELADLQNQQVEKENALVSARAQYDVNYATLSAQLSEYQSQYDSKYAEKEKYVSSMATQKAEAKATYDTAVNNYSNASTSYNLTVETLDNAIEDAEELVDDKSYALENVEEEDEEVIIIDANGNLLAPCSGYIMSVSEPETIVTESTTIENGLSIVVSDGDYAEIEVSISQDDIADIYIGMETNIIFDAYEDMMLTAVVDTLSLNPSGDMTSSVNYTVSTVVEIPQDEGMTIFSSMTSTVTFVEQQRNDVLAISTNYVIYEDGVQYVYLEKEDGSIEKTVVETGFSDGFDVEIVSGLQEGDIVKNESAVNNIEN